MGRQFGEEVSLFALQYLVEALEIRGSQRGFAVLQKEHAKASLLAHQLIELAALPNFITVIYNVFHDLEDINQDFLAQFCRSLRLPLPQELMLGLAFAHWPELNAQQEGANASPLPLLPVLPTLTSLSCRSRRVRLSCSSPAGLRFLRAKAAEISSNCVFDFPDSLLHSLLHFMAAHDEFATAQANLLSSITASDSRSTPLTISALSAAPDGVDARWYVVALMGRRDR